MKHRRTGTRREFLTAVTGAVAASHLPSRQATAEPGGDGFSLRYVLASCMYGGAALATILPEVRRTGATAIDIWPRVHGSQREQLDEMGVDAFSRLLREHHISLGCITQFPLGPFGLTGEMRFAARLGCHLIVTGGQGPRGLRGSELKTAVAEFVEQMRPHLEVAEETDVTIAIENHANNLIETPDALKWLAELGPSKRLGIAFAPYHLAQDERLLCDLIRGLGDRIAVFYAWQHGMGCMKKLPKEQELLQMPGRGPLDFTPLLETLREIQYTGFTEIFMHPVPRGVPILDTPQAVTEEINRARRYLERCRQTG